MGKTEPTESTSAISKAIVAKGSILTVIPRKFVAQLGVDGNSYLEHTMTSAGLLTRVVKLPKGKAQE